MQRTSSGAISFAGIRLSPAGIALTLVMSVLCFLMIGPFLLMLITAFKTPGDILASPPTLLPVPATWEHFDRLFAELSFFRHFINSMIVTASISVISLFLNALGGYTFAKFEFPLKNALFLALIMTMMIPMQVAMLPTFLILKELGLLNTLIGLIIPGASSVFGIFLMRQYMYSIPGALMESGRLDGCGEFRIFWSIILPQCKPVLSALGLFTFMAAWQDFLFPLIILHDEKQYTLPVALATLSGQYATDWGLLMAGAIVTVLPIAALFLIAQRRFIEGITLSGMK
jgi:multiple sugar transport system permease protein